MTKNYSDFMFGINELIKNKNISNIEYNLLYLNRLDLNEQGKF
jgi:hypothetical protein